jgi:hypothetical protein
MMKIVNHFVIRDRKITTSPVKGEVALERRPTLHLADTTNQPTPEKMAYIRKMTTQLGQTLA